MKSFDPKEMTVLEISRLMLSGVTPRPIALASTISEDGVNNLSPFSFYNVFSSNPPVIVFSPSRRGRDNSEKDTYKNLKNTGEVVIQAVTYEMIEQVNLSSCEYAAGVDEFVKAGFTPIDSDIVKPKRVQESPFHIECKLIQMIEMGGKAGSGNLAVCEVLKIHVAEDIIENGFIDPYKIDLVGRNGGEFYTRVNGSALFQIPKPGGLKGMGFDNLPDYLRYSHILSGNDLARMALWENIPDADAAFDFIFKIEEGEADLQAFHRIEKTGDYKKMLSYCMAIIKKNANYTSELIEKTIKAALKAHDISFAWHAAVYYGSLKTKKTG